MENVRRLPVGENDDELALSLDALAREEQSKKSDGASARRRSLGYARDDISTVTSP